MSKKMELRTWVEGTIVAAMGIMLSYIPIETPTFDLSLGLVPLALYSYRRGLLPGMLAGFVWGLLNIILGSAMKNFITVPQILFEYPFAFAFGGISGVFARSVQQSIEQGATKKTALSIVFGSVFAVLLRWFWHFWAGVFVWGSYAPKGMSPYWYSFLVNGSTAVVNVIYVCITMLLLLKVQSKLFIPKKVQSFFTSEKIDSK